jgi:hypothetical protein
MPVEVQEFDTEVEEISSPTELTIVKSIIGVGVDEETTTVVEVETSALAIREQAVTTVQVQIAGIQGPAGQSGPETFEVAATEDIPAFSFVTANGKVADSGNSAHFNRIVGITPVAVSSGFIVTVLGVGEVLNVLWNWTPNAKLFLNGTTLSAVPPTSGFNQLVAVARNDQTIIVRMEVPILL